MEQLSFLKSTGGIKILHDHLKSALTLSLALFIAITTASASERTLRVGTALLSASRGNPYQAITMPAVMPFHAIFDTLTAMDKDGNVMPSLAVSWSSVDAQTWIFELRPNVTFSNGEPLRADAIVVSATYLMSDRGRAETIGSRLYQVEEVRALDKLTVEVQLRARDAIFPLHASVWRIAAPALWLELGPDAFALEPVGTGPFEVTEWGDTQITLKANPASWRPPQIDGIEIIQLPEQSTRMQALLSDAIDLAIAIAPEDKFAVESAGGTFISRLTPNVPFIAFLTIRGDSPVKDVRVRQALNYAINRDLITEVILGGYTEPVGQLAFPGAFGFNPNIEAYPYDPEKAKELLADAGYGDGFDMEIVVTLRGGNDAVYYQRVAAELAQIGVRVVLYSKPPGRQLQDLFTGALDVDAFGLFMRGHDPLIAYRFRTCLGLATDRAPYHCDETLKPLVLDARAQTDPGIAKQKYGEVLAYEYDNPPGIFLWQGPEFDGLGPKVNGYAPVQDTINFHEISLND